MNPNGIQRGDYVETPHGYGRVLEVITHPTQPTIYRVYIHDGVERRERDYKRDEISLERKPVEQ